MASEELSRQIEAEVDSSYLRDSRAAEAYVGSLAVDILNRVGLWGLASEERNAITIAQALELAEDRVYALDWLLYKAAIETDHLSVRPDEDHFVYLAGAAPGKDVLAQAREALAPFDEAVGSTTEMVDYVAERYPAFLKGEKSGAAILFKGQGLERWERYFSAANPLYQIHNQLGALGTVAAMKELERPVRILELGAGTGGGTAALLSALQDPAAGELAQWTISDIAPSFLVRVLERLQPPESMPIQRKRLDFNRSFAAQGIEPGSVDIVVEVNALHNCNDLSATLEWVLESLASDGILVLSESLCQNDKTVHQDLIFNLLPPTDQSWAFASERHGLTSRFFTAAQWQRLLERDGLVVDGLRNSQGPELAWVALVKHGAAKG